jgi:hypothetical protein
VIGLKSGIARVPAQRPLPDRPSETQLRGWGGSRIRTRLPHRLPDFSVVVWIKKNKNFSTLRSEVLAAADAEPYETTEYQGMADFHFAMDSMADAQKFAEALKGIAKRPEVVVVRIMSLVDGVDERVTKH